jgi:PAS domain S-box-containing protein/putative nucleotidyltransferase with HDIG domain
VEPAISARNAAVFCAMSPDLHCILTSDGLIEWASDGWASKLGSPGREFVGACLFDLMPDDDATAVREAFERLRVGGPGRDVNARLKRGDVGAVLLGWRFESPDAGVILGIGHDLTERRSSQAAADAVRSLEGDAEQIAHLGSWRFEAATGKLVWSPQMYRIYGCDPSEPGIDPIEIEKRAIFEEDRAAVAAQRAALLSGSAPLAVQYRIVQPDGSVRWVEVRGRLAKDSGRRTAAVTGFLQDITEYKTNELASADREERLQAVIDNAPFGAHMYSLEDDGRLVFIGFNRKAVEMLGFDHTPLLGQTLEEAFPGNVGTETPEAYRRVAREGGRWEIEQFAYDSAGIAGVFEVHAFASGPNRVAVFFRDITEAKSAEIALAESEAQFRTIFEQASIGIGEVDVHGVWIQANDRLCEMFGYPRDELLTKTFAEMTHAADLEEDVASFEAMLSGDDAPYRVEKRYLRKDGSVLWADLSASLVKNADGSPRFFVTLVVDIDERKESERALAESQRFVQSIVDSTPNLIYIYSIVENRNVYANREVTDFLGYTPEEVQNLGSGLFDHILHPDDAELVARHHAECARAEDGEIRRCEYRMRHADGSWRWLASRDIPFVRDEAGEVTQILGFCEDITGRRAQAAALVESNVRLERMVYDVAEAMGRVIEVRDPYTRGHQERVAQLSKAIAVEMGLGADDVAAVEMAALVHDIGKLSIPAEILSMPRQLSPLEFSLIKEHPLKGYEILKDIDFPWPIADIVVQHHERLDGSGYPGALTSETLMPARILAVADVVEAMASHRPYRPALGIGAAMAELRDNAAKYDPGVVAACDRLYDDGRLELSDV